MELDSATRALHAGPPPAEGEPLVEPIFAASVYASSGVPGSGGLVYGRYDCPNWRALEATLGAFEDAVAVTFASGMAAAQALLFALCAERKRVVCTHAGYFGLRVLLQELRAFSLEPVFVDLADLGATRAELARDGAALLWAESPTNPHLEVLDLAALAEVAREHDVPLVVDNTTATAALQRPLDLGASATLTSLTKSSSGHADLLLGAVATRDDALVERLRTWRRVGGAIPGPFEAWLAHRGLRTLPLRVERQSASALALARHLAGHARVVRVHHPGLAQGAALELARRQMPRGFGPLVSFEVAGGAEAADRAVAAARLVRRATSFGGVESSWERRARWSSETAAPGLIRLSVGLEDPADLIADLERALSA